MLSDILSLFSRGAKSDVGSSMRDGRPSVDEGGVMRTLTRVP